MSWNGRRRLAATVVGAVIAIAGVAPGMAAARSAHARADHRPAHQLKRPSRAIVAVPPVGVPFARLWTASVPCHRSSVLSKNRITLRSYSAGRAVRPPTCLDSGISHSVADWPAAAR
jgi:hypothetical protein